MAKGLYLRLYSSIVENPKIHHLADILGCSYADALYVLIKIWCLILNRSSEDGDVSNYESKYLAAAINYPHEKDLYEALKEARLMTEDLKIYGWDEMSGKGITDIKKSAEQNRLRQQKHRDKKEGR